LLLAISDFTPLPILPLLQTHYIIELVVRKSEAGMRNRLKLAVTILVLLLAVACFSRFLDWMNLPSDFWFWSGLGSSLLLLVVVPSLIAAIWRPQRH
jgi:phosphoglycerol transferase MdoB-like AlkP superfamily enzyme